jgi:hypothetical protein
VEAAWLAYAQSFLPKTPSGIAEMAREEERKAGRWAGEEGLPRGSNPFNASNSDTNGGNWFNGWAEATRKREPDNPEAQKVSLHIGRRYRTTFVAIESRPDGWYVLGYPWMEFLDLYVSPILPGEEGFDKDPDFTYGPFAKEEAEARYENEKRKVDELDRIARAAADLKLDH